MGHILSALPFVALALALFTLGCALWVVLCVPCAVWMIIAVIRAPWGYEDSSGYHRGRP